MTYVHLLLSSRALTSFGFNSKLLIFTFHNCEAMSMEFYFVSFVFILSRISTGEQTVKPFQ